MQRWIVVASFAGCLCACSHQQGTSMMPPAASDRAQQLAASSAGQCSLQTRTFSPPSFTGFVTGGISGTDAWASTPTNTNTNRGAQPTIYHFNGSSWQRASIPVVSTSWNFVRVDSIFAIASNNVWAVGEAFYFPLSTSNTTPLVLHWNGARWSFVRNPPSFRSGHGVNFLKVSADAATDVWIAADSEDHPANIHLARWNGVSWLETFASAGSEVTGLLAISPTNVWMSVFESPTGVLHWDGTGLRQQPLPLSNGRPPQNLRSLTGTGQYDVWTSGEHQYIAHRSAGWSPFVVSAGTAEVHEIAEFRYGYAVATTVMANNTGGLLVYNNVDRWRPTFSPFGQLTAWSGTSVVRGTTSFWTDLTDLNNPTVPDHAALVVCPANPPAPVPL